MLKNILKNFNANINSKAKAIRECQTPAWIFTYKADKLYTLDKHGMMMIQLHSPFISGEEQERCILFSIMSWYYDVKFQKNNKEYLNGEEIFNIYINPEYNIVGHTDFDKEIVTVEFYKKEPEIIIEKLNFYKKNYYGENFYENSYDNSYLSDIHII